MLRSSRSYAQILSFTFSKNLEKYDPISLNHAAVDTAVQTNLEKNLEKRQTSKRKIPKDPLLSNI